MVALVVGQLGRSALPPAGMLGAAPPGGATSAAPEGVEGAEVIERSRAGGVGNL
jgi:hypothetical protein